MNHYNITINYGIEIHGTITLSEAACELLQTGSYCLLPTLKLNDEYTQILELSLVPTIKARTLGEVREHISH